MLNQTVFSWPRNLLVWLLVIFGPLAIAFFAFAGNQWDFSVPFVYYRNDDVWQLILTKSLLDNGWFLNNPFLGAPAVATGYYNSAAQTSSIHSLVMKVIGIFVADAVKVQNYYYFLNFSLISVAAYVSCRLLGVSRLFAVAVGGLYALNLGRLNQPYFAFISNHFMVPLAILVVVWCAKAEYIKGDEILRFKAVFQQLIKSGKFWLSYLIIFLTAISDGYYAFFTALLLGLSSLLAIFWAPRQRLANSLVPLFFAGTIIGTALLVMTPLTQYRSDNQAEFFPGGVQDPALTIHPFEAEVYAATLKTMLTPNLNHRVGWLARIGETMRKSGADARKYGYGVHGQLGSLASLFFLLLMSVFLFPKWILENKFVNDRHGVASPTHAGAVLYLLAVIAGFIFVCETLGGLGSIIAFVYPFIRAYERLSIFLIFVVLLAAAFFLTHALPQKSRHHPASVLIVAVISIIFVLDQIPVNLARTLDLPHAKRFLAERSFVKSVESTLSPGDMIYQYPYAQYMAMSPYYGMGSQAQMRSYLHSHSLRWSNGASKNSNVDVWHRNLALLPADELMSELALFGFKGALIDRWVVKEDEFRSIANAARAIGSNRTLENSIAEMTFFGFPDYGFHLEMDRSFRLPEQIYIHKNIPLDYSRIPAYLNSEALKNILKSKDGEQTEAVIFSNHPGLLNAGLFSAMRIGFNANLEGKELLGDVDCDINMNTNANTPDAEIRFNIRNNSSRPWKLNSGSRPITLGYHIIDSDGKTIRWDNGYRVKSNALLEPGKVERMSVKIAGLGLQEFDVGKNRIVFELLQEGNVWFGVNPINKVCRVKLGL